MWSFDCYSARAINIVIGLFLMLVGLLLFLTGLTFLPVLGFFLAAAPVGLSLFFLFAPPDKICFLPRKNK